jgi:hexosaminidase
MNLRRLYTCLGLAALLLSQTSATPQSGLPEQAAVPFHLMPVPAALAPAEGKLRVDGSFRAAFAGYTEPRLSRALTRCLQRLEEHTGIRFANGQSTKPEHVQLVVECAGPGEKVQSLRADESYSLQISAVQARLAAPSPLGILHGLETLLQLVDMDSESFYFPAVSIQDRPRFPWRGLMIDACRHWQPVEVIKRNLDAMAAVKLNVLHWHLSEDQGFRIESKRFPNLQGRGSDGLYYTQNQVREVVAYARDRGIRVVPEFDMPGHTTAWFPGYPLLASAPGPYQIERKWGVFDPCMDPTRESVYTFLDSFLAEIAPLFPDPYWHIGGDEVNGRQWNGNSKIAAFKKRHGMKTNEDLQAYFNKRLIALLAKHGKKAVGWDEIFRPDLPKSAVVQSWRGQASLAQSAQKGYSGILSWGYYLDHLRPASFHYQVDPIGQAAASLSAEQKALILGGEACMWGEYITSENIDSRIWPRAAAIAERLWSPAEVKDVDDMYWRLAWVSRDLDELGLTHNSGYPRMLERMVNGQAPDALKTLGDIVEPVKQLARGRMGAYTSLTPMNRLVDAIPPESDLARDFNRRVDLALAGQQGLQSQAADLRLWLTRWRDNRLVLLPVLKESYLLRELEPVSDSVAALAAAGLQALDYLQSGQKPPESWVGEQTALLRGIDRPQAELLIMIVPSVRKLITAASQLPGR